MRNSVNLCLSLIFASAASVCTESGNKGISNIQDTSLTQQLVEQSLKHYVVPLDENGVPVLQEGIEYKITHPYGYDYTISARLKDSGFVEVACKKTDIVMFDHGSSFKEFYDLHQWRVLNPMYAERSDTFTRCKKIHDECEFIHSQIDFECRGNIPVEVYNEMVRKAFLLNYAGKHTKTPSL